jgi:signal transduction histidine kinase/CheY-like chemotaxis protein
MKLRTQILAFLFLFAFAPLFIAFAINLPLVLDRFEHFYHQAHTQNLRADFRDLDQHLASRHELVSLLAKLPEPGSLLPEPFIDLQKDKETSEQSKNTHNYQSLPIRQYVSWINRIMADQRDIVLLAFLDESKKLTHAFVRNQQTGIWAHSEQLPVQLTLPNVNNTPQTHDHRVQISPIIIRQEFLQQDPRLFMTLNLTSPIISADGSTTSGHIIMTVDVTDFARYYQNTIWVQSDGQYLFHADNQSVHGSAFSDYPGLDALFGNDHLALWEGKNKEQVIWVPMLRTASGEPLWVGRHVDPSPIAEIQFAISWRVIAIMLVLVALIFYLARKFAHQAEHFDQELTDGITQILEEDKAIKFQWNGPVEIQELAEKLSCLSEVHFKNTRRALEHARELEASNRYKSEFLANVSHELRTPLNSILLLSKLIKEDPSCHQEQIDKATVINAAGRDLKSLIDNILDLSRIEAGKTTFSLHSIDLRELLEELVLLLKPQFEAKQLTLSLSIHDQLPESIYTDGEKVRQILKNFLSNALKFTEEGMVSVIAEPESSGEMIRLSVKDNGIGVDEEKQAHIFGAFQQADGSINRRHGGTGLGLTISTQLAELMGGNITLDSTLGQGATFSLHIPITFDTEHIDSDLVDLQIEEEPLVKPEIKTQDLQPVSKGQHIMIIDNDLKTLLFLTPLLEQWGYQVSGAGDREEAIETLEEDPDIDLILMDIAMSAKDGYTTLEQLEQAPAFFHIPVITMSDKDMDSGKVYNNIKANLKKPVDAEQLKILLEQTIT